MDSIRKNFISKIFFYTLIINFLILPHLLEAASSAFITVFHQNKILPKLN